MLAHWLYSLAFPWIINCRPFLLVPSSSSRFIVSVGVQSSGNSHPPKQRWTVWGKIPGYCAHLSFRPVKAFKAGKHTHAHVHTHAHTNTHQHTHTHVWLSIFVKAYTDFHLFSIPLYSLAQTFTLILTTIFPTLRPNLTPSHPLPPNLSLDPKI